MKQKEIATALGLSVALAVTGCGTTNEPVEIVQVEESTEPVEVIEADTTAPEVETTDESLITISKDEEPLHDTEADGKIGTTNSKNKYMGMTADELLALMASPEFSKLSSEEQSMILEAYGIAQENQDGKTIPQSEIDKMTHAEVEEKLFGDDGSSWEQYTDETVDALWKRFDETNPNNADKLIEKHKQEVSGGEQTGPQPDSGCYMPACEADNGCYTPQADGWISY